MKSLFESIKKDNNLHRYLMRTNQQYRELYFKKENIWFVSWMILLGVALLVSYIALIILALNGAL